MRKFLLNALLFLGIFVIGDRIGGAIFQAYRPIDYQQFIDAKTAFFNEPRELDVLIIGDSHAADALDPALFSQVNLKAFNLSVYNSSPFENYFTTKAALEYMGAPPKVLILGTNPIMFNRPLNEGKYTTLLLPFRDKIALTRRSDGGFNAGSFLVVPREKQIAKHFFKRILFDDYTPTRQVDTVYQGYLRFTNQTPDAQWNRHESDRYTEFNPDQFAYFERTIQLAVEQNIEVILVHPPIWRAHAAGLSESSSYSQFNSGLDSLVQQYNLHEFPASRTGQLNQDNFRKEEFLNPQHLNNTGAQRFTKAMLNHLLGG